MTRRTFGGYRPLKRLIAPVCQCAFEVTPSKAESSTGHKSFTVERSPRIVALAIALFTTFVSGTSAHERCGDGANLKFPGDFAVLTLRPGDSIGEPLDCHELAANDDIVQQTATGMVFTRPGVGIRTFTDGWRHCELTVNGSRMWSMTTACNFTTAHFTSTQPDTPAVVATHQPDA